MCRFDLDIQGGDGDADRGDFVSAVCDIGNTAHACLFGISGAGKNYGEAICLPAGAAVF